MQISSKTLAASLLLIASAIPGLALSRSHRGPTAQHASKKKPAKPAAVHTKWKPGQRGIDDTRATEIQAALVKAGYMTGEPSGHWDSATEAAFQKLQGDNGWQTKLVPDSRGLIKLGLGSSTTPAVSAPAENTIATTGTK